MAKIFYLTVIKSLVKRIQLSHITAMLNLNQTHNRLKRLWEACITPCAADRAFATALGFIASACGISNEWYYKYARHSDFAALPEPEYDERGRRIPRPCAAPPKRLTDDGIHCVPQDRREGYKGNARLVAEITNSQEQLLAVFRGRGQVLALPMHKLGCKHLPQLCPMDSEEFYTLLQNIGDITTNDVKRIHQGMEEYRQHRRQEVGIALADVNTADSPLYISRQKDDLDGTAIQEELSSPTLFAEVVTAYIEKNMPLEVLDVQAYQASLKPASRKQKIHEILKDMALFTGQLAAQGSITSEQETEFDARMVALKHYGFAVERYTTYQWLYNLFCDSLDAVSPAVVKDLEDHFHPKKQDDPPSEPTNKSFSLSFGGF